MMGRARSKMVELPGQTEASLEGTSEKDMQEAAGRVEDAPRRDDYINAEDIFYWMEDHLGSDIPLCAIWIDIPTGCRFCC
jgi:alpha-amylase/alpha-mannosidase (GH57 family)